MTTSEISRIPLALVTGGGGFLGGAIISQLLAKGWRVRSLHRGNYPHLEAQGVGCIRGSVDELAVVRSAVAGCEVVFHVAAKAGISGPFGEFYRTNVIGTDHVLRACREAGVARLVFTSSPSVTFDGVDQAGVDESAPYAQHFTAYYPQTKAWSEQAVLAANSRQLATVALRPHLIWGPGDQHLLPRLAERARLGRLRQIGAGENLVDTTYIDTAAEAHLLAAERLSPSSPIAGQAYFIAQGEPWPLWTLINRMLVAVGAPPVTRRVSPRFAIAIGWLMELAAEFQLLRGEPPMTRFVAQQLSTAHWFRLTRAERELGFVPKISIEEGLRRLAAIHATTGGGTTAPRS